MNNHQARRNLEEMKAVRGRTRVCITDLQTDAFAHLVLGAIGGSVSEKVWDMALRIAETACNERAEKANPQSNR